jgi:hypothetical protein
MTSQPPCSCSNSKDGFCWVSLLAEVSICAGNSKEKRPLPRSDTFSVARMQELPWQRVIFTTWYQTCFCGSNLVIQRLTVVWRQTNVSRPDKTEKIAFFCSSVTSFTVHLWKYQLHNLEHFKQHEKPRNDQGCPSRHFDTTGSMSLQRNSALSMRTICFSKPVSELVLQTGLTRPRSWTEEVSDLGRGLFSFELPAQIETSASRELLGWSLENECKRSIG